jgi:hypothetical protein
MINIQLPTQLSILAGGQKHLKVQASNLKEVFDQIDKIAPMIRSQIFDSNGSIRRFVSIFINDQQITNFNKNLEPLHQDSSVLILISIAGG